jgi:hypothetical protein
VVQIPSVRMVTPTPIFPESNRVVWPARQASTLVQRFRRARREVGYTEVHLLWPERLILEAGGAASVVSDDTFHPFGLLLSVYPMHNPLSRPIPTSESGLHRAADRSDWGAASGALSLSQWG